MLETKLGSEDLDLVHEYDCHVGEKCRDICIQIFTEIREIGFIEVSVQSILEIRLK